MSAKAKLILSVVSNILIVLVIVLALIVSITSFTAKANGGVPDLFGYTAFSIQTNSMKPVINSGDYIFGEKCDGNDLEIGDIISFYTIIQDKRVINTHEIIDVTETNGITYYQTQGRNNPEADERLVAAGDVISKYNGFRIPVMGSVLDFLGTKLGFFLCIVLPVLLYTLFQVYKLIVVIMHNQKAKMLEDVNGAASEELKQAVIAEYLAKQKQEEAQKQQAEETTEETKQETEQKEDEQ